MIDSLKKLGLSALLLLGGCCDNIPSQKKELQEDMRLCYHQAITLDASAITEERIYDVDVDGKDVKAKIVGYGRTRSGLPVPEYFCFQIGDTRANLYYGGTVDVLIENQYITQLSNYDKIKATGIEALSAVIQKQASMISQRQNQAAQDFDTGVVPFHLKAWDKKR